MTLHIYGESDWGLECHVLSECGSGPDAAGGCDIYMVLREA